MQKILKKAMKKGKKELVTYNDVKHQVSRIKSIVLIS